MTSKSETPVDVVVRRYPVGPHVLVAELCRPKVKNAFNDAVYQELIGAIEAVVEDDALHALVITGHGDYFTSGADIAQAASLDADGVPVVPSRGWPRKFMDAMVGCPKLLVAAVNGPAIGIGVTLLLHCDLVYATPGATFWTPFMRIGIVPEFASSVTFPRVLGPELANEMLLLSRRIGVDRAVARGLVGQVLPGGEGFVPAVVADLAPVLDVGAMARSIPVYKRLLRRTREPEIREAIHQEFIELDRRFLSGEMQEIFLATMVQLKSTSKL